MDMETPIRILVVDDEPDIRNILRILLTSRGYAVEEAENGRKAVELVRAQPDFDLIIMDIMMPDLNGIDACGQIRALSVAPVLFLTAKAQDVDKSEAYHSGGDDYLVSRFPTTSCFCAWNARAALPGLTRARRRADRKLTRLEISRERGTVCKNGVPLEMQRKRSSELLHT